MAGDDAHFYRTADDSGLAHNPLNAIVGPRPIGWISTVDAAGVANLAPYSYFNAFHYAPAVIGFASDGWKDSVANVEATGSFVFNLATRELAEAMNTTSAGVGAAVDEFRTAGLTAVASREVVAPRVRESPVNMECALTQLIRLRDAGGDDLAAWLVLGQVVAVHIDRHLLVDGTYDTAAAAPILRAGGTADYVAVQRGAFFQMTRPDD